MLQMHDDWQGVAVASQLNSKTPQRAQPATQAILLAVQQSAAFGSAFTNGESAGRVPPAGVTGPAVRKLKPEPHAWASTAAGDAALASAGRSSRAKRLSRIVL